MVCRDHEGEMPISKENRDPSKSIRELHMENVAAANILQSLRDSNAQLVQEVQSLQHKAYRKKRAAMRHAVPNPACSQVDVNKLKQRLKEIKSSQLRVVEDALKEENLRISALTQQVTEIQTHSGATEEVNKWRREVKEKELRKQQNKEKKDKLIEEQREKAMDIWERKEELRHILMEKDQAIKVDEQAVQQLKDEIHNEKERNVPTESSSIDQRISWLKKMLKERDIAITHQQKMQLERNVKLDSVGDVVAWLQSDLAQWQADIEGLKRAGESMEHEIVMLEKWIQNFTRVCGANPAEFVLLKRNELAQAKDVTKQLRKELEMLKEDDDKLGK